MCAECDDEGLISYGPLEKVYCTCPIGQAKAQAFAAWLEEQPVERQSWGAKMPGFLEEAERDALKAEEDLNAAYRRIDRMRGEMAGYENMTAKIADWTMLQLFTERDRLGASRDGGHDLMGRYLALLDEIEKREHA